MNPAETRALWDEALDIVIGAWTNEVFSWEGKYFKIPPREIIPKPLQKPHPPLWCASTGPETHEIAGRKGIGLLSFTLLVDPEELKRRIGSTAPDSLRPNRSASSSTTAPRPSRWCIARRPTRRRAKTPRPRSNGTRARRSRRSPRSYGSRQDRYRSLRVPQGDDEDRSGDSNFDYMDQNDMIICGDPDTCIKEGQALPGGGMPATAVLHADLRYPASENHGLDQALG